MGRVSPARTRPGRAWLVWSVLARATGARLEPLLCRVRGGLVRYGLGWYAFVRCGLCRGGMVEAGSPQFGTVGAGSMS